MSSPQAHAFSRADRTSIGIWWWTVDRWMLGVLTILIFIGVAMSFAASPAAAPPSSSGWRPSPS
jgi:cell division protein FtsW